MIHSSPTTEIIAGVTIAGGAVATAFVGITNPETWVTVWEKGGVALVVVLAIFLLAKMCIPSAANWVKGYLEGLETRNAETQKRWEQRMDKSQREFLDEIKEERVTRQNTENAFREMLHSHKRETVEAIKEQTDILRTLGEELRVRPCQMRQPQHQHREESK